MQWVRSTLILLSVICFHEKQLRIHVWISCSIKSSKNVILKCWNEFALISPLSHQIQMWMKWTALKLNQCQQQILQVPVIFSNLKLTFLKCKGFPLIKRKSAYKHSSTQLGCRTLRQLGHQLLLSSVILKCYFTILLSQGMSSPRAGQCNYTMLPRR